MTDTTNLTRERRDLLEVLDTHRDFLRETAQGLSDDDARRRSTVSALSIGGIVKHVTQVEETWANFMAGGAHPLSEAEIDWSDPDPAMLEAYQQGYVLLPDETLAGVLDEYERVATATDELVRTLADLDAEHPLPDAPWFTPGASWSVRRTITHVLAETAQHAGHADIIREAIDGQKTMG